MKLSLFIALVFAVSSSNVLARSPMPCYVAGESVGVQDAKTCLNMGGSFSKSLSVAKLARKILPIRSR